MERANWYWILFIVAALVFSSWHSFAADLQYISQEERNTLKSDFESAQPLTSISGQWTCDMYGVSSNLQVVKSVSLYSFQTSSRGIENHGAQGKSVPVYKAIKGELVGTGPNVDDQIRKTKNGQLLSKLSHDGHTVAYSRCRPG